MRELRLFTQVAWAGLEYGELASELEKAATEFGGFDKADDSVANTEELEMFATAQRAAGFPLLVAMTTIRVWTLLETLVTDIVAAELRSPRVVTDELKRLRGPLWEFLQADPDERAEFLADLLAQETKAKLKPGVGRFECLLNGVGLGGPTNEAARRYLLELSELRNVFVHRDGIADGRLVERCPWLNAEVGKAVVITMTRVGRYAAAASWYSLEISRRIAERETDLAARERYAPTLAKKVRLIDEFAAYLSSPEDSAV